MRPIRALAGRRTVTLLVALAGVLLLWAASVGVARAEQPACPAGAEPFNGACAFRLRAGVTPITWPGPTIAIVDAIVDDAFTFVDGEAAAGGGLGALAVWHLDDPALQRWAGWGAGVPKSIPQVTTLETGEQYHLVSEAELLWVPAVAGSAGVDGSPGILEGA